MSELEKLKVTLDDFKNNRIAGLSDRPSADGMSSEELKNMFDAGAINVLMPALNALIDYLVASGASGIGVDENGNIVDLQTLLDTVVCFAESNAKHIRVNDNGRLETSPDGKVWSVIGTGEAATPEEIGAARAEHSHTPEEIGARPNANLLHNWYFGNPVNRLGITKIYGTGQDTPIIDRWFYWSGYSENYAELTDSGIHFNDSGEPLYINRLYQIVDSASIRNKQLTLSLMVNGAVAIYIATNGADWKYYNATFDNGLLTVTFTCPDSDSIYVMFQQYEQHTDETITAIKLELGDTQTLAHQDENGNWVLNEIPDYAEQMAICQQYNPSTGEYIGESLPANGVGGVHNIRTYTSFEQLGLTSDDFVVDDFVANINAIYSKIKNNNGVMLYIGFRADSSDKTYLNFFNSLYAKINSDCGMSLTTTTHHVAFTLTIAHSKYTPSKMEIFVEQTMNNNCTKVFGLGLNYNAAGAIVGTIQPFIHPSGFLPLDGSAPMTGALKGTDGTNTYNYFGEHNKPSGSYTGNGSSTERTINVGGTGKVLFVWSEYSIGFVTETGAFFYRASYDTSVYAYTFSSSYIKFVDGVLTIASSSSYFNSSSYTYNYQLL